jgi:enoyl-CoA hydratase/3-hydroxyacyl-CoA dehydrogenase
VGPDDALRMAQEIAGRWSLGVPRLLRDHGESKRPFDFQLVRLTVAGGIAEILLNRPDALNALNEGLVSQLAGAFDEAERRADVRTIVLRGAGKAFVAGADVKFFVQSLDKGDVDKIRGFTRRAQDLYRRIDESPKLVVCRLDGLSLGGGSELALCADVILATDKGSLGFPETGIGIYPGLGGTQRTSRRIGVPLTRWLVLTGSTLDAKTAEAIGLVDEIVPVERMNERIGELHGGAPARRRPRNRLPPDLEEISRFFADADVERLLRGDAPDAPARVAKEASKVRHKAPIATRIADRLIREGASEDLNVALEMEFSHLDEIFATRDAYEGLKSLGVKRPEFQGR